MASRSAPHSQVSSNSSPQPHSQSKFHSQSSDLDSNSTSADPRPSQSLSGSSFSSLSLLQSQVSASSVSTSTQSRSRRFSRRHSSSQQLSPSSHELPSESHSLVHTSVRFDSATTGYCSMGATYVSTDDSELVSALACEDPVGDDSDALCSASECWQHMDTGSAGLESASTACEPQPLPRRPSLSTTPGFKLRLRKSGAQWTVTPESPRAASKGSHLQQQQQQLSIGVGISSSTADPPTHQPANSPVSIRTKTSLSLQRSPTRSPCASASASRRSSERADVVVKDGGDTPSQRMAQLELNSSHESANDNEAAGASTRISTRKRARNRRSAVGGDDVPAMRMRLTRSKKPRKSDHRVSNEMATGSSSGSNSNRSESESSYPSRRSTRNNKSNAGNCNQNQQAVTTEKAPTQTGTVVTASTGDRNAPASSSIDPLIQPPPPSSPAAPPAPAPPPSPRATHLRLCNLTPTKSNTGGLKGILKIPLPVVFAPQPPLPPVRLPVFSQPSYALLTQHRPPARASPSSFAGLRVCGPSQQPPEGSSTKDTLEFSGMLMHTGSGPGAGTAGTMSPSKRVLLSPTCNVLKYGINAPPAATGRARPSSQLVRDLFASHSQQ